ncbi:septum site-determining protein Ssd [Cellulomonas fimi]|uniref:Pilus assembly protein FlpE n=1 Tax=Cellulomonas fimi TaxID=1708 RepID=A0A7Y0LZT0_CELFI|nr:septum site-determining protein Ssd [Cellulomonas fimi]NMR19777.1 pilus assembly protein FlpE [Cellulomonas fimi]
MIEDRRRGARVLGVVGARGGLGASSLAAALAHRLAGARGGARRTALVDLDRFGSGVDVLLGIEAEPGLRWPDLRGARGEVSGDELTALLPRWSRVTVLSADRSRPGPPDAAVVDDVLDAIVDSHDDVVLDLDRAAVRAGGDRARDGDDLREGDGLRGRDAHGSRGDGVLGRCSALFVLAGRDLQSVAGLLAMRGATTREADVRLVVRGPAPGGLGVLELAHVVDLPVAASMDPQRGFAAALERGGGPPLRRGQPLARVAEQLVAGLT